MKFVAKSQAKKHTNSPTCVAYEYSVGDATIDAAVGVIRGRYPEKGYVVNEVCRELVYVISGVGTLTTHTASTDLAPGDMALLNPGEAYFFTGTELTILMPCAPAWYPEQHKEVAA